MSQANVGLIRRDLLGQAAARTRLRAIPVRDAGRMAAHKAADSFMHDALPLDPAGGTAQTPQDYVEQVTATTGMPWANVRRNMAKVHGVLSRVETVLAGLTRGLDLSVLDEGVSLEDGHLLSFFPRTDALGVVLPSNSPGVHSLWAPATVHEDAAGAEARQRRAVDAAPHHPGAHQAPASRPRCSATTRPITLAATRSCGQCGRGMVFGDVGSTEAVEMRTRASRCTDPATARW